MTANEVARSCRCGARLARDNPDHRCATCQKRLRELEAQAPDVAPQFWDTAPMRHALSARHIGKVCRAYRFHPVYVAEYGKGGIPQEVVAAWLGLSQSQISRAENGPPITDLDRLILWAQGLRIPQRYLWFRLPADSALALSTPPPSRYRADAPCQPPVLSDDQVLGWAEAEPVELVNQLTRRDLAMNRREVIKGLTAIAIGTPLLEVLDRWVIFGEDRRAGSRGIGLIGDQEITHIEHAAVVFREWDDQFGGGLRRKAVVGQLNEVADLLRDNQPVVVRRRLLAVMARLSETSAIMSWDSGHQGLAQRYYVTAFRAARSAEDWAFGANILAGMARQMLYLGRPSDALELVRIAQSSSAGHATPGVVSMLHVREAWAYAKLGRVNAFHRAVGQAEDAFANVRTDNEPDWMRYFDIAELEGTIGGRLLELARQDRQHAPLASERIARAVESRKADRLRSSALDQLGLVEARVIEGNYDEAANLGESALGVAAQTPSDRVQVMLTELYGSVAKYASIPAISSLRGQMRDVLSSKRDPNGA